MNSRFKWVIKMSRYFLFIFALALGSASALTLIIFLFSQKTLPLFGKILKFKLTDEERQLNKFKKIIEEDED